MAFVAGLATMSVVIQDIDRTCMTPVKPESTNFHFNSRHGGCPAPIGEQCWTRLNITSASHPVEVILEYMQ